MSDVVLSDTPLWLQAGVYPARLDRSLIDAVWNEGVVTGLVMAPRGAGANLSVDVSAGFAVVTGDDQAAQGKYLARTSATVNVPTLTPPTGASQKRIDVLTVHVSDPNAGGAAGDRAEFRWVQGTATTGTPVAPAIPATAVALGQVLLLQTSTAVNAGDIDRTLYAVAFLRSNTATVPTFTNKTALDAWTTAPEGAQAWTTTEAKMWTRLGTRWWPADGKVAAASDNQRRSGITTTFNLVNGAFTVDVPAGRTLRFWAVVFIVPTGGQGHILAVKEGGTTVAVLSQHNTDAAFRLVSGDGLLVGPTAGVHTYQFTIERVAGTTIDIYGDQVTTRYVIEDAGPAA